MEEKEVLFSVVIPVRNRAEVVRDTLNSVARQCYRPFELIIVDNASDDGTPEVLEAWRRDCQEYGIEIRIEHCPTPGAAAARNHGLNLVRTPWVLFFDSDDIMLPTHLLHISHALNATPDAEIIGWDVVMQRLDGSRHYGRFFGRDMQRHNLFDGAMATQRWAARTELVRRVGGWDEAVGYWDDIELGSRLLAAARSIEYAGEGEVIVRESVDSISAAGACAPRTIEPALTRIERTLGRKGRRWCRLKRAVEYALSSRGGSAEGLRLMKEMKASPFLWAAYHYTRMGGRGIARLMRF